MLIEVVTLLVFEWLREAKVYNVEIGILKDALLAIFRLLVFPLVSKHDVIELKITIDKTGVMDDLKRFQQWYSNMAYVFST